jgi:hypothetical protein
VSFAALLMGQQMAIFCGLMRNTTSQIRDVEGADIWVMDKSVQFVDDVKPMSDNKLLRVRGVEGVAWAVKLYKGQGKAKLADGNYQQQAEAEPGERVRRVVRGEPQPAEGGQVQADDDGAGRRSPGVSRADEQGGPEHLGDGPDGQYHRPAMQRGPTQHGRRDEQQGERRRQGDATSRGSGLPIHGNQGGGESSGPASIGHVAAGRKRVREVRHRPAVIS